MTKLFNLILYIEAVDPDIHDDDSRWEETGFVTTLLTEAAKDVVLKTLRKLPGIDATDIAFATNEMEEYEKDEEL